MQSSQAGAHHPDADLLTAFAEQSLTKRERESVLSHLATCPTCREVVSLTMPALPASVQPQADPVKPLFWKWPVLRWGAVAASVVIVAVAVSIGNLDHNRKVQQTAEVHSDAAPLSVPSEPSVADKRSQETASESLPPAVTGVQRPKIRYEKVAPVSPAVASAKTP